MNTHNSFNALPPSNIAGAILRAGFTDVPETERFIREIALELYNENGGDQE